MIPSVTKRFAGLLGNAGIGSAVSCMLRVPGGHADELTTSGVHVNVMPCCDSVDIALQ